MRQGLTLSAAFLLTALADDAIFAEVVPPELVKRTMLFVQRFKAPSALPGSTLSRARPSADIELPETSRSRDGNAAETSEKV